MRPRPVFPFLTAATVVLALLLQPFLAAQGAAAATTGPRTVAGMIGGDFSVTAGGSANYVVPIQVPPGTAGVQPNLALAYNNQAVNGVLGMGWTLHGLSSITRCAATKAVDGYVGSIRFDTRDRFCLDGLRLILVSGSIYGAPESVYHTEKETWTKITAGPACGSGPCFFTAVNKDGTTLEFGTTRDSQVPIPGRPEIFAWKIHRTVDLNHNTVEVEYQTSARGESYPLVVKYTGHTASGNAATVLQPQRAVTFSWEGRDDVVPKYVGGFLTEQTQRLARLTTSVRGQAVLEYRFTYEKSAGTGRSLLTRVDQCAPDPDSPGSWLCLQPTRFDWQSSSSTVVAAGPGRDGLLRENWCSRRSGFVSGWADFDGDGLDDLTCSAASGSQYVLLSTRDGLKSPNADRDGLVLRAWCRSSGAAVRWADFNGDGKADLHCDDDRGDHWVMVSDGRGLKSPNGTSDGLVQKNWCASSIGRSHWINFDGDGRADLTCAANDGSHYVLISDGTALKSPNQDRDGLVRKNWCSGNAGGTFWGDFNGDGMSDLNCSQPDGSHYVLLSNGSGVASPNAHSDGLVRRNWCTGRSGDRRFATTDFNGNRLFDFSCHTADGDQYVLLSTGTGVESPNAHPDGLLISNWCPEPDASAGWEDFNGDGLTDLGCSKAGGGGRDSGSQWVQLSTGTGLRPAGSDPSGLIRSDWCGSAGVQRIDFNGDALGDLHCPAADGSQYVLVHASPFPDLLTGITNGFGGTFAVSYRPLTDPSVYQPASSAATYPILDVVSPLYVVAGTTQGDGRGSSYSHSYRYSGARTDLEQRSWLGFATMTVTESAGGRSTLTTYSQELPTHGFVLSNVVRTASGEVLAKSTYEAEVLTPHPHVHQVLPRSKIDAIYEAGRPAVERKTVFQYDRFGNLELDSDLGDPATAADDVFTCLRYDNDTVAWQLGYERQRQVARTQVSCQRFLDADAPAWDPADGLRWSRQEYDSGRNPTVRQVYDDQPAGGSSGAWLTFQRQYDEWGNVQTVTDPAGNVSTFTYDDTFKTFLTSHRTPALAAGLVLETTTTFEPHFGLLVSTIDANGNEHAGVPDAFGRVVKTLGPRPDGDSGRATEVLTTIAFLSKDGAVYDETRVRQSWQEADPETWLWSRTYLDGMGRIYLTARRGASPGRDRLQSFLYDAEGRPWRTSYPYFAGATPSYAETTYDDHDRPILVIEPDGTKVRTEYHLARSQVTSIVGYGTPAARTTTRTFDSRGQVVALETANGGVTTNRYSRLSQQLEQSNPVGATTVWSYDSLGRLRSVTDSDSGSRTYRYDATGLLRTSTDGAGNRVDMDYDAVGRPLRRTVTAQDGTRSVTTYDYDQKLYRNSLGRLTRVSAPDSLQELAYDRSGLVAAHSLTIDGQRYAQSTTFDPEGRLVELHYPDGSVLHHAYGPEGYLRTLDLRPTGGGAPKRYVTYGDFDALGQVGSAAFGNGVTAASDYYPIPKALGRLHQVTVTRGAETLSARSFTWNGFGQVQAIAVSPESELSETFSYDSMGWLIAARGPYSDRSYSYDLAGNVKALGSVTFDYPPGSDRLRGTSDGLVVQHDGNGNVISKQLGDGLTTFEYDASANLVRITAGGKVEMKAVYDPEGRRLKRTDGDGVVSRYLFADYDMVEDGDSVRYTKTIEGIHGPLAAVTVDASHPRVAQELRYEGHRMAAGLYDPGSLSGWLAGHRERLVALAVHPRLAAGLARIQVLLLAAACLWLALAAPARRLLRRIRVVASRRIDDARQPRTVFTRQHRVYAHLTPWVLAAVVLSLAPEVHADLRPGSGYPRAGEVYFHLNQVESTVLVTGAQGQLLSQVTYEPYGQIDREHSSGPDDFRPKFSTKELDLGTGLYYFGARYHDPSLGRFLQPDAARQFSSPYTYVGNDPEDGIDPDGNFAFLIAMIVIGAVSGAYFGAAAVNHSFNPAHWDWRSGKTYAGIFAGAAIGAVGGALGAQAAEAGIAAGIAGDVLIGAGENAAFTAMGGGSAKEIGISALEGAAFAAAFAAGSQALSAGFRRLAGRLEAGVGELSELETQTSRALRELGEVCASFPAGTMVAAEHGPVPIESIEVGDRVWSADLDTGEPRLNEVSELLRRQADGLIRIDTDRETFRVTAEHPVYVAGLGWAPASRLQPGDRLVTRTGQALEVTAVAGEGGESAVFNFEVGRDHNYFASGDQVLVHNGRCRPGDASYRLARARYMRGPKSVSFKLWKRGREAQHLIPYAEGRRVGMPDSFLNSAANGMMIPSGRSGAAAMIPGLAKGKLIHIRKGWSHPKYSKFARRVIALQKPVPWRRARMEAMADYLRSLHKHDRPSWATHVDDLERIPDHEIPRL